MAAMRVRSAHGLQGERGGCEAGQQGAVGGNAAMHKPDVGARVGIKAVLAP